MRLHGEPIVWGLHPKRFADPLNLRCHATLILEGKKVLDHGITERDVEAAIAELGQIGGVARDWLNVLVPLLLRHKIQAEHLDIRPPGPAPILPEGRLPSDVQDS